MILAFLSLGAVKAIIFGSIAIITVVFAMACLAESKGKY